MDEPQFMSGTGAGEHIDIRHDPSKLRVIHGFDLGTGQRRFTEADADARADRPRGVGMVAGDHFDPDAGGGALSHGRHGFFSRRIDDAQQSEERTAPFEVRKPQVMLPGRGLFLGHGQACVFPEWHSLSTRPRQ